MIAVGGGGGSDELNFLSPDRAAPGGGFHPVQRSPLERALGPAQLTGIEDISLATGKIEVRGEVAALGADAGRRVRFASDRALVLCRYDEVARIRAELGERCHLVIDQTGALAGLRIARPDGMRLLRRLTELDLAALPAVGSVAGVRTYVLEDDKGAFLLFFAQEYGHYMAEVVIDAVEGLVE
jgi:catechol 2,3-dioxygenase-like lactoylglutathione lyase family enzyme